MLDFCYLVDIAEKFTAKSKVTHVIQCAGKVRGIAQLKQELFVCTHLSEQLAVYDVNIYSQTRQVTVPDMKQ